MKCQGLFYDCVRAVPKENLYASALSETKFNRPIYLNEFESAILPDDTPQEVVDALDQQGLKDANYKAGDDADRMRVVRKQASEETRFSVKEGEVSKRSVVA